MLQGYHIRTTYIPYTYMRTIATSAALLIISQDYKDAPMPHDVAFNIDLLFALDEGESGLNAFRFASHPIIRP